MRIAKVEDSLYDQLLRLPDNRVGEIINGQLHTHQAVSE